MKSRILSAVLILVFITSCNGTLEVGLEHSPTSAASLAATFTTALVPTVTFISSAPIETAAPTDLPAPHTVQIFLIAVDDNGQTGFPVGCGDSAIPVQMETPPTQGVLKAALVALLSIKDQYYGQSGLYNALYQSDLLVETVSIVGGKASVYLIGTLLMGGECDAPRVQAQLEQTVLQFPTVTEVAIYINGKPLAEVLSLKG
jgi:Sporulation and spore germination